MSFAYIAVALALPLSSWAEATPAPPSVSPEAPSWLFYVVLGLVSVFWIYGVSRIVRWLQQYQWNLALAVSEEATLPSSTPPLQAGQLPPFVPSTSRLIALIGAVIMSAFFIGLGYWVIWALFNNAPLERAKDTLTFFLSGTALFTPYAANKVASIFQ